MVHHVEIEVPSTGANFDYLLTLNFIIVEELVQGNLFSSFAIGMFSGKGAGYKSSMLAVPLLIQARAESYTT